MTTTFDTIAEAMRGTGLSTGLPQLDRIAPLGPGHLGVLVGASGVGKTRVADHIAATLNCTHERGVLTVTAPTTIDALDSSLAFGKPALCVVDPVSALAAPTDTSPTELIPTQRTAANPYGNPYGNAACVEQHAVHPAELGRIAGQLRELAIKHQLPILACHRYTPIRDSVTGLIVSTEAVNPLLDVADVVVVVRVQADPRMIGLEITRNRLGPTTMLRVPLLSPAGCDDVWLPTQRKS